MRTAWHAAILLSLSFAMVGASSPCTVHPELLSRTAQQTAHGLAVLTTFKTHDDTITIRAPAIAEPFPITLWADANGNGALDDGERLQPSATDDGSTAVHVPLSAKGVALGFLVPSSVPGSALRSFQLEPNGEPSTTLLS